jgi:hypothetical protein
LTCFSKEDLALGFVRGEADMAVLVDVGDLITWNTFIKTAGGA